MEFSKNNREPIFGVQASWLCYEEDNSNRKNACKNMPKDAKLAFLFLQTTRTQADKILEEYNKQGNSTKPKITTTDKQIYLTRIQCPAINFDSEGTFSEVYEKFIRAADTASSGVLQTDLSKYHSCITVAWCGENRIILLNNN